MHLSLLAVVHVLVVDGLLFLELVEEVNFSAFVASSFVFFKRLQGRYVHNNPSDEFILVIC